MEKLDYIDFSGDHCKHFLECEEIGEVTQLNIMMHGPPGVGKTSLSQIILGKPALPIVEQNSTIRAISSKRLSILNDQIREISDQSMLELIEESVLNWQIKLNENLSTMHSSQTSSTDSRHYTLEEMKSKLPNVQPSSRLFSSKWLNLIDSGGQPQFQDMLPLLYRSPSFQIVLMRLTEGLEDKPKMCYTAEGKNIESPDDLHLTNLQYIESACQIAADANPPGKVMIVGTHKNDIVKGDIAATLATLERGLAHLHKKYDHVLIPTSNGELILAMNTIAIGEERKVYIKEMHDAITAVTDVLSKPQPVPLRWFIFQLALRNKSSVIRMDDCLKLADCLGIQKDTVKEALIFFNQSALLLYYPDAAPDLVLTKIDPIIERLSQLVATAFKVPPQLRACSHLCTRLKEKGLFDVTFCDKLFTQFSDGLSNQEFLKLLETLKLAVLVNEKEQLYFLPSVLSYLSLARDDSTTKQDNRLSHGFILQHDTFNKEGRILPHGFFFTSIVELLSNRGKKYQFKMHSDKQYRNQMQVYDEHRNIPGAVILTDKTWWIQVTLTNSIPSRCPIVLEAVKKAINYAIKRLKLSSVPTKASTVFPCPINGHSDHYCSLTRNKERYTCSDDAGRSGSVHTEYNLWTKRELKHACSI